MPLRVSLRKSPPDRAGRGAVVGMGQLARESILTGADKTLILSDQESSALDGQQGGSRPIESRKTSHHREIWRLLQESVLLNSPSPAYRLRVLALFRKGFRTVIPAGRNVLASAPRTTRCEGRA